MRRVVSDCCAWPALQSDSCFPLSTSHVYSCVSHFFHLSADCSNPGVFLQRRTARGAVCVLLDRHKFAQLEQKYMNKP